VEMIESVLDKLGFGPNGRLQNTLS
ncbi:MAG: hypothetical protein H6Q44_2090, partial [Deltaproteobacteria bacterium]|nr:hypothetical protein [Deltaproteobacteria bacterium]